MGEDDAVSHFFACNDHDRVLFISEKGVAFGIRAFQVPLASRAAKGVPLPQVINQLHGTIRRSCKPECIVR